MEGCSWDPIPTPRRSSQVTPCKDTKQSPTCPGAGSRCPGALLFHQAPYPQWWASLVARQYRISLQCQRPGFDPWVGNIPWRRKWQLTPVFLPGESHGRRSLVGYSPRGHKELDTTERLHFQSRLCFVRVISKIQFLRNQKEVKA